MQHRLCVCGLSAYADADASASSLPPAESRRESMKSFILRSETWVELWCGSVVLAGVMRMTYSSPPPLPPGIRLAFQIDAAVPQSLSWKSSLWATGLLFSLSLFAVVVCFFDVCHSNTHTHTHKFHYNPDDDGDDHHHLFNNNNNNSGLCGTHFKFKLTLRHPFIELVFTCAQFEKKIVRF